MLNIKISFLLVKMVQSTKMSMHGLMLTVKKIKISQKMYLVIVIIINHFTLKIGSNILLIYQIMKSRRDLTNLMLRNSQSCQTFRGKSIIRILSFHFHTMDTQFGILL